MGLLIVEGQRLIAEAIARALDGQLQVVGFAFNGLTVFPWLDHHTADVALIDLCLPGRSGRELIADLTFVHPELRTVALFGHDGPGYRENLRALGARGFVPMTVLWHRFSNVLMAVAHGAEWVTVPETFDPNDKSRISNIEHQILEQLPRLPVKAIAGRLQLGMRTIELHLQRMRRVLGAASNAELVQEAIRRGYLAADPVLGARAWADRPATPRGTTTSLTHPKHNPNKHSKESG